MVRRQRFCYSSITKTPEQELPACGFEEVLKGSTLLVASCYRFIFYHINPGSLAQGTAGEAVPTVEHFYPLTTLHFQVSLTLQKQASMCTHPGCLSLLCCR